jgi:Bacteriophage T4-like portal protein (Gp20)
MAINQGFSLFGFRIKKKEEEGSVPSFAVPANEDGATTISSSAFYAQTLDLDGITKNEVELITRYREMALQSEIETAIEDIINEAIVQDDDGKTLGLVMDKLKVSDKIKSAIEEEFDTIKKLLNYNNMASDIFRRYYVDGRLFYHVIIDVNNPKRGILELRYIDPRKIRKIREVKKRKDEKTGVEVVVDTQEYYIYNDRMVSGTTATSSVQGVRIAPDSVVNVNSGLMDARRAVVLSYLHKAIKPLNQLRMIEDASIINKLVRAPQRRIFYVDVGNMPKAKAEQYLKDMMTKYKNKITYDSVTGEVRDDRRHLSMLEDFWMPRRDNGQSTKIETLPSSDSFDNMDMVEYFEKKLYKSLNVPTTRINPQQTYNIGRSNEITRDEIKFAKFIDKLRNKFSDLFDQLLRIQLVLKGVCSSEEWDEYKEEIFFDFIKDNNYIELKEAELMQGRLGLLGVIDPFVGKYYSKEWIQRNVLRLNDEEIVHLKQEMEKEDKENFIQQADQQKQQIQLQAQGVELQNQLMPQADQQIDAGEEQAQQEQPPTANKSNPYNIQ